MKTPRNQYDAGMLRQNAEDRFNNRPPITNVPLSEADLIKLNHELEVHQIELEMLNDELRHAWAVAEVANDKYIGLYDLAPSGYFTLSNKGEIIELNITGARMLGKDRQDLRNSLFRFFVSEKTKPIFNIFLEKIFQTKTKETCEVRLVTNRDIQAYVLLTGIITENQKQCNITMVDITERYDLMKILEKSEAQLAQAQEVAKIGSWETDLSDLMVLWSAETYRIFEVDPDNFQTSHPNFLNYVHPDDREKTDSALTESIGKHTINSIEHRIITPSGLIKFIEERWRIVYDDQGQPLRAIGTCHDITARKQATEDLKLKNEQLIQVNAEKDKFFSIIAHDLRSPFNAFLGLTRMLVEELDTFSLDELRRIALSMRNSATNLYGLIENLLEWSCLRRGVTNFDPETFLLKSFGEGSLYSMIEQANKKGIEIRYEISEDIEVYADRYMLGSTLRNLVSNALKFTHKEGIITFAAKRDNDNSVEIFINDTGIGMNKNMIENLFRVDGQTNRKGTEGEPSTGLGLIICKEFVEKHGGKVWVESEEDKGSSFRFTLPARKVTNDE